MEKNILNFHFDNLTPSLSSSIWWLNLKPIETIFWVVRDVSWLFSSKCLLEYFDCFLPIFIPFWILVNKKKKCPFVSSCHEAIVMVKKTPCWQWQCTFWRVPQYPPLHSWAGKNPLQAAPGVVMGTLKFLILERVVESKLTWLVSTRPFVKD